MGTLGRAAAIALACFAASMANGRSIGSGDVVPAGYLAVALVRGDGVVLDRFDAQLRGADGRLPGYLDERRGHVVSRYPIGPALLAAPLALPQVWWLDATRPGWDRDPDRAAVRRHIDRIGKTCAAAITAAAVGLLFVLLREMGFRRAAWAATLAAAFGTGYLPVASQALWQHGPAAFCLTGAMIGLRGARLWCRRLACTGAAGTAGPQGASPPLVAQTSRLHGPAGTAAPRGGMAWAALAGAATALMVVCRTVDAVFAAAIGLWALLHLDRPARWAFFVPAFAIGGPWAAYNVHFFDTLTGGYAEIEQMHPWAHGTRGTFSGSIVAGGLGTLFSPSHGLLVYSPWVLVAAVGLVRRDVRHRLASPWSLPAWLAVSLVPSFALLATYSCWWGGHCFGARFWIDATPILAILLAAALEASPISNLTSHISHLLIFLSVALNAAGFLCYPSTWHNTPTNADRDHARLWDWRDNEVTRGLREGIRPRAW